MRCKSIGGSERELLIAVDRSKGRKITLYSITVSSIRVKDELMRYVDSFKHVKLLGRLE